MTPFTENFLKTGEANADKLILSMQNWLSLSTDNQFSKFARIGTGEIEAAHKTNYSYPLGSYSLENLVRDLCDLVEEKTFSTVVEHGVLAAPAQAFPFSPTGVRFDRKGSVVSKWRLSSDSSCAEMNPEWCNARRLYLDPEKSGTSLFRVTPSILDGNMRVALEHQYLALDEPAPYSLV